jgi:hypothetical protein
MREISKRHRQPMRAATPVVWVVLHCDIVVSHLAQAVRIS